MLNKYVNKILVGSLIIGALSVAAIVLFTNRPATVSAMPAGQSLIVQANSQKPLPSADNAVLPKNKHPIVKTENNIKIEVLSSQIEDGYFGADICFDFPSNNPAWSLGGPENLKLSNGVTEIGVYSIDLIADPATGLLKKDDKGKYVGRCDHVRFPLSDGFALENLKISISKLITDLPETPDCSKTQAKLDTKNSGIKIKCDNDPGKSGIEIVSKPNEMNVVQAQKLITDALTENMEGPWEFEIDIP